MIKLTIDNQEIEVAPTKIAYDPQYKKQIEIPTTIYDAAQCVPAHGRGESDSGALSS